ncbi:hypothetical protein SBRCBS47491_007205 [Sporothrix bragantina]|uniref:Uncharacterized protein n=1 Tax=Sporothrix bragantina TaxID=671064 RepID=A0ABP0CDK5_9PEZI
MKRATFFKSAGSSSPEQSKSSRSSIRGRISAPIPIPDPLDEPAQAPAPAPATATTPEPILAQEVAVPEETLSVPTSPPPPTRVSPPPPARASPAPPVVSAFSEDLENSEAEEEAEEEAEVEDAEVENHEEAGKGEEVAIVPAEDVEGEAETEAAVESVDLDTKGDAEMELDTADANIPEASNNDAEPETNGPEETVAELGPMPPLQSPKVRAAAFHRRIPTAELAQHPLEPQQQQQQLPLPQPVPHSPSPPQVQYKLMPQTQPGQLRHPPQSLGPSPPPLSSGPSAMSSARASGIASAGTPATSPAFRHRTNPSSTLRYSGASGMSLGGGAGTSAGNTVNGSPKPQRKKSTLRGAFSKLFSRRKKTDSQILPTIEGSDMGPETGYQYYGAQQQQQQQQQQQHQQQQQAPQHRSVRSDPTILSRPRDGEPKRSASLPITEYDRALRSHSIGPDDLLAIESARNSFQTDQDNADGGRGLRGATNSNTANRSLFQPQTQGARRRFNNNSEHYGSVLNGNEWTGLSPRPASVHGRRSQKRLSGSAIGGGGASSFGRNSGAGETGASRLVIGGPIMPFGGDGGSRNASGAATDPSEIGRAITSNGPDGLLEAGHDTSSRRRSRSLSGLHDLALDQAQSRGRNDEIRYWRESYDPAYLSPLSSHHDMSQDVDNDDGDDNQDGLQNGGDTSGALSLLQSLPASPVDQGGAAQLKGKQQQKQQAASKIPQPSFPFGNTTGLSPGPTKISQAYGQAPTVDTRLGGLETRMNRMERVVGQLCHAVPSIKEPATATNVADQIPRSVPPFDQAFGPPAIPPIPAMYQSQVVAANAQASSSRYSNSRHSAHSGVSEHSFDSDMHSHMSFGDGQTYIGSLHPPSSSATQAQSILAPASGVLNAGAALSPMGGGNFSPALRPTSTSTVRGATSLPALYASATADAAMAADLLAQLESERAVRQTLETQVKKLNERVNALSTTMYAMLRDPAAARPSTRSGRSASGSREKLGLGSTPSAVSLRGQSAAAAASVAATQLKAESVLQTAKALGHGVHSPPSFSPDMDTESEDFQTPLGEYHYNYSDENDMHSPTGKGDTGDDTKRAKKAARTLSLGQLTLGKSAVQT